MKRVDKNKINTMFDTQRMLNNRVGVRNSIDYAVAFMSEITEALECLNWKWRPVEDRDIEAFKMELIDALFFAMSMDLDIFENDKEPDYYTTLYLEDAIGRRSFEQLPIEDDNEMIEQIIEITADIIRGRIRATYYYLPLLIDIFGYLGGDFDEIYSFYVQKATLNIFRLDNGIQDGKYNKNWNGKKRRGGTKGISG